MPVTWPAAPSNASGATGACASSAAPSPRAPRAAHRESSARPTSSKGISARSGQKSYGSPTFPRKREVPLLCTHPLRVGLCGFRHRRVLLENHRLADHLPASVHRPGPRRPQDRRLATKANRGQPDGPGAPLATAACSTGPSATGQALSEAEAVASVSSKGDSFRLRPGRGTQLAVQGRAHPLARALGRTSTPPVLATAEWVH